MGDPASADADYRVSYIFESAKVIFGDIVEA